MEKYQYDKIVLLKQTNLFGNTYFSNYFDWQGEAREFFLFTNPQASSFFKANPQIKLITHSAFNRFISDTYLGDRVAIKVSTRGVQAFSFFIVFRYYVKDVLVGEGWQKICFHDLALKQFIKIPQVVADLIKPVQED